jgi:hypothetical protein
VAFEEETSKTMPLASRLLSKLPRSSVQELRAVLSAMEWRARREETSKTMSLTSRLLSSFTEEHGAGTSGCAVRHGMARTARRSKQDNAAGVSFALKFHRGARCRNSGLCCPPWKQARAVWPRVQIAVCARRETVALLADSALEAQGHAKTSACRP